jgi:hypothetical protein
MHFVNQNLQYENFKGNQDLREFRHPNLPLVGFKYSEKTAFEKNWTDITRTARGIVFDTKTLEPVTQPFTKFFNSGENVEDGTGEFWSWEQVEVLEKLDGSMIQLFLYEDEIVLTTPGSFASDQANAAYAYLPNSQLVKSVLEKFEILTLMFEFIHSTSAIVVSYPQEEWGLKLIGARKRSGEKILGTVDYEVLVEISQMLGLGITKKYDFKDFQEMMFFLYEKNKEVPFEGVVIRNRENDERLKFKTPLYCQLHATVAGVHINRILDLLTNFNKNKYTLNELESVVTSYEDNIKAIKLLSADFNTTAIQMIKAFKTLISQERALEDIAKQKLIDFVCEEPDSKNHKKQVGLNTQFSKNEKSIMFSILNQNQPEYSKQYFADQLALFYSPKTM